MLLVPCRPTLRVHGHKERVKLQWPISHRYSRDHLLGKYFGGNFAAVNMYTAGLTHRCPSVSVPRPIFDQVDGSDGMVQLLPPVPYPPKQPSGSPYLSFAAEKQLLPFSPSQPATKDWKLRNPRRKQTDDPQCRPSRSLAPRLTVPRASSTVRLDLPYSQACQNGMLPTTAVKGRINCPSSAWKTHSPRPNFMTALTSFFVVVQQA